MRTCTKCNRTLDENRFQFKSVKDNVRKAVCKDCVAEYDRLRYSQRTDFVKDQVKAKQQLNKAETHALVKEYLLANPCIDCGETDPVVLEFDHRDPTLKEYKISSMYRCNCWETIKKEIDKCDVRCANCHRRKTAIQLGWYQ